MVPEAVQFLLNECPRVNVMMLAYYNQSLNVSHCNADLSIGGISTGVPSLLPAILGPLVNLADFQVIQVRYA